jgi:hypothetical protein
MAFAKHITAHYNLPIRVYYAVRSLSGNPQHYTAD